MKTTLVTCRPPPSRRTRAKCRTWSTISSAVRSRRSPSLPEAQKAQPTAQPTWVETQTVARPATSMSTASTGWPSVVTNSVLRAVPFGAARVSDLAQRQRREARRQLPAQRQRQRRDGVPARDQSARERLIDLPGAVVGLVEFGERGRDGFRIEHPVILRRAGNGGGESEVSTRQARADPGTQRNDHRADHRHRRRIPRGAPAHHRARRHAGAAMASRRRTRARARPPSSTRRPQDTFSGLGKAEHPVEDITLDPALERAAAARREAATTQAAPATEAAAQVDAEPAQRDRQPQPGGLGLDWGPDLSVRTTGFDAGAAGTPGRRRRRDHGRAAAGRRRSDPGPARSSGPRGEERRPGGGHAARAAR